MYTIPCLLMWDFIICEKYSYVYISIVKKGPYHLITLKAIELEIQKIWIVKSRPINQLFYKRIHYNYKYTYISQLKKLAFGSYIYN